MIVHEGHSAKIKSKASAAQKIHLNSIGIPKKFQLSIF